MFSNPKLFLELPAVKQAAGGKSSFPSVSFSLSLPAVSAVPAADRNVLGKQKEKMPAILVASKMKSGLPKPVHSAAPILHVPTARSIPQPCYLKFGNKVEVTKPLYSSQIPLKSSGQESAGDGLPPRKSGSGENGFDTQVSRRRMLGRGRAVYLCTEGVQQVFRGGQQWGEEQGEKGGVGGCVITSVCSGGMVCIPQWHVSPRADSVIWSAWWSWWWGAEGWCCVCLCSLLHRLCLILGDSQKGGGGDVVYGCVLCVLPVGANCNGRVVWLGGGKVAACPGCGLCSAASCPAALSWERF